MRPLLIAIAIATLAAAPGLASAQQLDAVPHPLPEGKLWLRYIRWDAASDQARRWDRPAMAITPGAVRWGQAKDTVRAARIGYGLSDGTELFAGVTKAKGFDARQDWKDVQDRKRRAYSVGVIKRW